MGIFDRLRHAAGVLAGRNKSFYGFQFMRNAAPRLDWKSRDFLRAYESSLYVYALVKKRAEKVGQTEFRLFTGEGDKAKEVLTTNPILDLIYKPNPFQTKNEFLELYQTFKDLTGSAYIYLLRATGKFPTEMYCLRPDWVVPQLDQQTGLVFSYKYTLPDGAERILAAADVIASHYPSPLNALSGQSPLKAGASAVELERELGVYHNSILKNGGRVEGILSYKNEYLTQEQVDEIKRRFDDEYADAENSGKPLILYGGAEYQNLGLTPTELSFLETKRITRDDLLLLFGVPKAIVAQTDDVNLANAREAVRIFLAETIKPLVDNLTAKLDEFLVPMPYHLEAVNIVPDDVDAKIKLVESGMKTGYMTINEGRAEFGLDPVENGDKILVPFSMATLDDVASGANEPPPAAPPAPAPAATPTPAAPPNEPAAKSVKDLRPSPLMNKEIRQTYGRQVIKKWEQREREGVRKLKTYFKGQEKRVIDSLSSTKNAIDDAFDLEAEVDLAKEMMTPAFEKWLMESGAAALTLYGEKKPFELSKKIRQTIGDRMDIFAKSINEKTIKQLQGVFAESVAAGEDRDKLVGRIKKLYGDISTGRAKTIARTEVGVASQVGTLEGYKQAGAEIKIWVSVLDDRTRDSHVELDGEEQPIDKPFSNGLMMPLDPTGAAEEVINCRCSI